MSHLVFDHVDIVFGSARKEALERLDKGETRDEILKATSSVIGVADASLTVEEGEICVLMGLSGSGKSTLLRAANGLNAVSRGQVLLRHRGQMVDIATIDAATLRAVRTESVAMVFQQFALLPWRTVRDNVGLGLELRGTPKAERDRIVDEKLKMVQLDQWADKYGQAGSIMKPLSACARDGDRIFVDDARHSSILMDGQGKALVDPLAGVVLASTQTSLKDIIALRQESGHGVGIIDEAGYLVGVCRDADIYGGLLREKRG